MATFQISKKNKNKTSKNVKMIMGWTLLAVSTFVFLFSVTSLIPFLQYFFLGILGIFVYPLCVLGFLISLALLNNKKYVMPKKYAIFLCLSLYLFLSIIQLIIIGSPGELSYGEYILLNYTKQMTAGGLLIGFIPSSLVMLMGSAATYVVLSIGLVTCIAFFVEAVLSLRSTAKQQKPIKLQIKEKEETQNINSSRQERVFKREEIAPQETKVMFEANQEEEEKHELSAREKLGLARGYKTSYQTESFTNKDLVLPEEKESKGKIPEGMSIREYLLSPPTLDMDKFLNQRPKTRTSPVQNLSSTTQSPITNASMTEINRNFNDLKTNNEIKPSSFIHEESFDFSDSQTIKRGNLPDVKPEEITSEAEDIIRSVVEQEKIEREEEFKEEYKDNISNVQHIDNYNVNINHEPEASIEQEQFETFSQSQEVNDLEENKEDIKEYIDFDEIDSPKEEKQEPIKERENLLRDRDGQRRDFARDLDRNRQNLTRENEPFKRPMDEIDRRKSFVSIDEGKKEEKIKPYKYSRPSLDLITTQSDDPSIFNADMPAKRVALENALENFGVPAKVQNVVIGPTVTRYEIEMPEGISVKRVLSLDADIAYALSAKGEIRIEAPIPGRSIVGIEVPNSKVAKVSIKDVLQSKEFSLSPSPLTFALGKDITGNVKVCNLQKMPHLLVAGTTGSGKSVCLNSIIVSLLYKSSPDEVKFIMIDPKQVELSMYEGLPHMVVPKVITDPTKAVNALQWAVDEMERRFKLISEERVRNIDEYNKIDKVLQNKVKKMPYIVIIFDEFADFMAIAKNEIEDKIRRLAGKARAAGIHLILATQRPSTDVVTGTLKANLPARIAFKVAGRIDSEVIMGSTGAEKLLGYGDMLYKPTDSAPARLQGCFIDTPETKDIVNYIIDNNEEIFDEEAFNAINNPNKNTNGGTDNKDGVDPLLPNALKICIDNGVASTTMVQRKLSIGYPRAARIIDQMEERGYISAAEGSKQRSVYISIEEFYAIFGDIYD